MSTDGFVPKYPKLGHKLVNKDGGPCRRWDRTLYRQCARPVTPETKWFNNFYCKYSCQHFHT